MSKAVREVALDILLQIEKSQAYSNLLLNQTVKNSKLDQRDVGLLTEIVYGTIQRRDTLDYYLTPFVKKGVKSLDDWVRVLLRLSIYQLIYLDRVPDRAIVHEAVTIAKKRGHQGISGMVNGVLRSFQRQGAPSLSEIKDPIERLALEMSFPTWLIKRWIEQYGEAETRAMCESSLVPPTVTVRVNRLKASVEHVVTMLQEEGIKANPGYLSEDAIVIEKGNVFQTETYKQGFITAQDESSMLVGRAVDAYSGMDVIDVCAAPGGKSTHIAEQMDNEGQLLSFDLHDHKIKLIKEQANRLGLTNLESNVMDARNISAQLGTKTFDRVLVDAPCTGLGVIRRKPDIKWTKKESDIQSIQRIQLDILEAVAPHVKQGGKLIYSTCTIDKWENEETVQAFLAKNKEFKLDHSLSDRLPSKVIEQGRYQNGLVTILPHDFQTDGFFIASMVRG
ncbi:16S rRNA (cytosine(967)-C(5))-methyltransferase RsmB [Bacillus suaedae]|uniref:16S rRNA (cytosine(967)-C(5))-methyltransferase n=1 Tax=Halalkalibacter suaedae TaxID=2822140 RepID=A0A940WST0_9BACI|nr:16S rRNA (cytosine(967)-C(5))-methyltransferase RsmB [Bacillus suaedae]MBP3952084.1 16S rRNA (cytosine(967)-C(5))-methyltransferase RsmB [Bacillus suaedae]